MINHPKRKHGFMTKLKSKRFGKEYIFFDTESFIKEEEDGVKFLPLRLGVAIYVKLNSKGETIKREICEFRTTDEFFDFIMKFSYKGRVIRIFAHNIKHDIMVLNFMKFLADKGIEIPYPVINGLAYIQTIKTHRGKITLLDSANFVPFSLRVLGKNLGIEKGEPDFETVTDEELFPYCLNDVEIVEAFILGLIRFTVENNLGAVKNTLASQAMTYYRTAFIKSRPFIHNIENVLQIERQCYFGGRTECFYIGELPEDDYYYVDVNSLYPYHMLDVSLPTQPLTHNDRPLMYGLEALLQRKYCIAEVTLNTDENFAPIRYKNKLMFPTGAPRVTLHHAELIYAFENNMIQSVHQYSAYHTAEIFGDYVMYFYDLKKRAKESGNKLEYQLAKLFMNSLYGKFGQRYKAIEVIGNCNKYDNEVMEIFNMETGQRSIQTKFYGKIYVNKVMGEAFISSPVLAGAITSLGRMHMYKLIKRCGKENVFYTDTDSLIVNQNGMDRLTHLVDSSRLGFLDIEGQARNVRIYGNKDYVFGSKSAHKGIPKSARSINENTWEYEHFMGFKTWLRLGAEGTPYIRPVQKRRLNSYDKGRVLQNGRVIPHVFLGNHPLEVLGQDVLSG